MVKCHLNHGCRLSDLCSVCEKKHLIQCWVPSKDKNMNILLSLLLPQLLILYFTAGLHDMVRWRVYHELLGSAATADQPDLTPNTSFCGRWNRRTQRKTQTAHRRAPGLTQERYPGPFCWELTMLPCRLSGESTLSAYLWRFCPPSISGIFDVCYIQQVCIL